MNISLYNLDSEDLHSCLDVVEGVRYRQLFPA